MYKEHLHYSSGSYFQVSCTQTKDDLKDIINRNEKEEILRQEESQKKAKI